MSKPMSERIYNVALTVEQLRLIHSCLEIERESNWESSPSREGEWVSRFGDIDKKLGPLCHYQIDMEDEEERKQNFARFCMDSVVSNACESGTIEEALEYTDSGRMFEDLRSFLELQYDFNDFINKGIVENFTIEN